MKRFCKRMLCLLLAAILCAGLLLSGCSAAELKNGAFTDVPADAWYAPAAAALQEKGLMNGVGEGRFDPQGVFTRAQLATVLYRMAGSPAVTGEDAFDDTEAGTWYTDAVLWASQNGVINGYGNGLYGTNDPTTQEQLTVMLWRDAGRPVLDYLSTGGVEKQASQWAYDAVVWAKETSLIHDVGAYQPKQPATRALVADMVYRYLKNVRKTMNNGANVPELPKPRCVLLIEANGKKFYAHLEDNSSAKALVEKLNSERLTVAMHDYGGFEKVGDLPWELPRNDTQITTKPGDVILYNGNQITIYYGENSWNFTRLAQIGNVTKEQLLEAFGAGDVSVQFSLEWSE